MLIVRQLMLIIVKLYEKIINDLKSRITPKTYKR